MSVNLSIRSMILGTTIAVLYLGNSIITVGATRPVKLGFGLKGGKIAGKDFVAKQLIVGLRPNAATASIRALAIKGKGKVVSEIEGSALLLEFPSEASATAAVNSLRQNPNVKFLERNGIHPIKPQVSIPRGFRTATQRPALRQATPRLVSRDSGVGLQWHHTVIRKTADLGGLSTTPPTVAILSTGVDYNHPDLVGKVLKGIDFVDEDNEPLDDIGAGTFFAGIVAARSRNNLYAEGVSHNSKILPVRICSRYVGCTDFGLALGLAYARTTVTNPPTKVVLSGVSFGSYLSSTLEAEIIALRTAGKVLVVPAGDNNSSDSRYESGNPNIALRVMATEHNDCRATYSSFNSIGGTRYNIAAPGLRIPSTLLNDGFGYQFSIYDEIPSSNTAAAVTAGAAALIWGQFPTLTRDQLVARIVNNGKTINCGFAGSTKRLDVRKAIFQTSETALIGRLIDPFNALPPSINNTPAQAKLVTGTTQLGLDSTDRGGSYEITGLTAGTGRSLIGSRTGYITGTVRAGIPITAGVVNGPYTDAIPQSRPVGNATITLDWKSLHPFSPTTGCVDTCLGSEFDLLIGFPPYIITPGAGSLTAPPFVRNPRDSQYELPSTWEPTETAVIGVGAVNGTYKIYVLKKDYYRNPFWTGSQASVQIYNGAAAISPSYSPPTSCGNFYYWHIGNLVKNNNAYTFTPVNLCSNSQP